MRLIIFLLLSIFYFGSFGQHASTNVVEKDSLFFIEKKAAKGFHNGYLLFIPKGTPLHKKIFLLVEPNNTGKISDSIEVHKKTAMDLASVRSVGNNIATELKIPLLVPVFLRPASNPFLYTHALDRDVMLETATIYKRLDLQLVAMIADAAMVLKELNILIHPKIFMNGFSASATFTNRFSFLHPEKIQALAMGGFNGKLMIPQKELDGVALNYPIGINDFDTMFNATFNLASYQNIPQFIYMGKLDDNDAVLYDDAYSEGERKIIQTYLSANVQERYLKCEERYRANSIFPIFKSYEQVGHWTTSSINLDVVQFFLQQIQKTK
jgi:hypothetical protein